MCSYGDVSPQDLILSRATNSRPKIYISPDAFGVHNYCSLDSVQASPYHSPTLLFVLISVRLKDHTYVNTLLVLNEFHHDIRCSKDNVIPMTSKLPSLLKKNGSEIHTRISNDNSSIEEYNKKSSIYRRVPATLRKYKFFYILAY